MRIATNMVGEQERKIKARVTSKDDNGSDGSDEYVNFMKLLNHRCLISWSVGHIWNIEIMFRHSHK